MKEYIDSEDLKRQWPRTGEYIDFIRKNLFGTPNYDIEMHCEISLGDPQEYFKDASNAATDAAEQVVEKIEDVFQN